MGFSVPEARLASASELLSAAREDASNDSIVMNELIRRYEPLIQSTVSSLSTDANLRDDMVNGARWGLVRAVRAHDGRPDGFVSYMVRFMRGEARRAIERFTTQEIPLSPDVLLKHEATPEPVEADTQVPLALLSDKQRGLVAARYWHDRTYAEIARGEGTTLSAVRQRFGTIHRKLEAHMTGADCGMTSEWRQAA